MQPFTKLTGVAAPLPMVNVDTDQIIPAKWLKTIKRTGLGVGLFESLRYLPDGSENPEFVLNRHPHREAQILIAGQNFGCGSSREHAPWALLDYGIRCVIAPSFADIFHNNCYKNGILPIVLPQEQVDLLMKEAENAPNPTFTVDLRTQEIRRPTGNEPIHFQIDPGNRDKLLQGLDEVGETMRKGETIDRFEAGMRQQFPWLQQPAATAGSSP
jgi:3-isopropylmalate/(R)-2-methylmalate dehydratase small subunit